MKSTGIVRKVDELGVVLAKLTPPAIRMFKLNTYNTHPVLFSMGVKAVVLK
ncbi:hypothetical protein ACFOST_21705 [Cytobacillus kochii]|uniref:hypothetical protein n=1 Tax=Cytobacillus kochii TaxID=859143 RepID=UPI00277D84AA|nr:hypothetical protein [Cytobacillus kochii]MDQ0186661.1 hypothetical protein [Cytobacillus kochii]